MGNIPNCCGGDQPTESIHFIPQFTCLDLAQVCLAVSKNDNQVTVPDLQRLEIGSANQNQNWTFKHTFFSSKGAFGAVLAIPGVVIVCFRGCVLDLVPVATNKQMHHRPKQHWSHSPTQCSLLAPQTQNSPKLDAVKNTQSFTSNFVMRCLVLC
eukprot:c2787_g1_i2.p1 GENE.c2787_g1_i2~~c2787_g1_i2.p1  ORF type:complete len:171 (+),score=33.18 c2787_g1_i2:54-515(+)